MQVAHKPGPPRLSGLGNGGLPQLLFLRQIKISDMRSYDGYGFAKYVHVTASGVFSGRSKIQETEYIHKTHLTFLFSFFSLFKSFFFFT